MTRPPFDSGRGRPPLADSPGSPGPGATTSGVGYRVVRAVARLLLNIFYDRIEVTGAENLPATGPLVIAANHHNSVVDAMLLVAVVPRPLRALANAPLFKHPLLGPFLRAMGALPVHRRQEAGNDPAKNATLFAETTATLQAGGAILIFPEGRTQPEPVLQSVRTGAARMVVAAGDAGGRLPVTLLPVGLVYQKPGTFRTGRALVLIGAAVDVADCLRATTTTAQSAETSAPAGDDGAAVEQSVRRLTDRLAAAMRAQIVEADDRHTLRLLGLVEELLREHDGTPPRNEIARVAWQQRAMRIYRTLNERASDRLAAFREGLEAYDAALERAGLAASQLFRRYSWPVVLRFTFREVLPLLLGAPLALFGMIAHVLPYQVTALTVRLIPHTDEEEATDKIVAGLLYFPLAWAAEAYAAYAGGGRWALIVFLAALLPTGFFALAWRERLTRVWQEGRAFVRYLRDRELPDRLHRQRQALVDDLATLAEIAAEPSSP